MKRVGYLYETMCDLDLIKLAIHKAAQGKTRKRYIRKILSNVDEYALRIRDMLVNESVQLSPGRKVTRFDYSCMKEREITVPKFYPDQIIHWVVMLVIEPVITRGMYRFTCGSVPNRGGLEAKKYVERSLKDAKVKYAAQIDIRKFFNSVQPKILMRMFGRKIKDKKMLSLIEGILEVGGECLPIGFYTSQWFSNFFLEGFDHYVKEVLKIRYFVRNVDDMVFVDTNKRKLHKAIKAIKLFLKSIGLRLKPNYQVWKIDSRPIDFVGYRFYRGKTLLRKKIFYRICRRTRKIAKTKYITVHQAQGLLSLLGWLKHINGRKFYKEHIYPFAPKWKLKKIVSNHAKKLSEVLKHGKAKTIQQGAVAC